MGNIIRSFKINVSLPGNLNDLVEKLTFPRIADFHPLIVSVSILDKNTSHVIDRISIFGGIFHVPFDYVVKQKIFYLDENRIRIESKADVSFGLVIINNTNLIRKVNQVDVEEETSLRGNPFIVFLSLDRAYISHMEIYRKLVKNF